MLLDEPLRKVRSRHGPNCEGELIEIGRVARGRTGGRQHLGRVVLAAVEALGDDRLDAPAQREEQRGAIGTVLNLTEGRRTATIESKTNFLRPAPFGSLVLAECTPLQRGKTLMVWQTRVLAEDGALLALVTQTQLIMR